MRRTRLWQRIFGKASIAGEKGIPDPSSLDPEALEMIRGVAELARTTVKEIMVPRIDVVGFPVETPFAELVRRIAASGHSRFPVYRGSIDNVVGILHAKDLLRLAASGGRVSEIGSVLRKPYFVPESKKLNSLLREFKRRRLHIAIAVDEYGGTSGIVTMEDVLEEIVGDIQDEFDNERRPVEQIGDNVYLCDGRLGLDEFNRAVGAAIPEGDVDTLGGFVFDLIGHIPSAFEKASYGPIDFVVQEMEGNKILTVKVIVNRSEQAVGGVSRSDAAEEGEDS